MLSVEKNPWGRFFDKQPECYCFLNAKELSGAFSKGGKFMQVSSCTSLLCYL